MEPIQASNMTPSLRRARRLLARWRERLLGRPRGAEGGESPLKSQQQEVRDRWDHVEVQVARIEKLEGAWKSSVSEAEAAFAELDTAWRSLERSRRRRAETNPRADPT